MNWDNTNLAQEGLTAGSETSVFMIPGTGDSLGRTADPQLQWQRERRVYYHTYIRLASHHRYRNSGRNVRRLNSLPLRLSN